MEKGIGKESEYETNLMKSSGVTTREKKLEKVFSTTLKFMKPGAIIGAAVTGVSAAIGLVLGMPPVLDLLKTFALPVFYTGVFGFIFSVAEMFNDKKPIDLPSYSS